LPFTVTVSVSTARRLGPVSVNVIVPVGKFSGAALVVCRVVVPIAAVVGCPGIRADNRPGGGQRGRGVVGPVAVHSVSLGESEAAGAPSASM